MIARNCTKIFSDMSVKKHQVLFLSTLEDEIFLIFSKFGLTSWNLNRLTCISEAKSVLRLSNCFLNENFK